MTRYALVALAVLAFWGTAPARCSEVEELRQQAAKLKAKAAELARLGRKEEAEQLERKVRELMEATAQTEYLRGHLAALRDKERRLRETRASERDMAELREQIARTERALKVGLGRKNELPEAKGKLEAAGERIKHLRLAAEHLRQAGAHDLARGLLEKAEAMEREAREAKMRLLREKAPGKRPEKREAGAVEELRREVRQLREELNELRKLLKERR